MEHLDKLLKLADAEFKAIADNGKFRSREEIDSVYKLVDIVKDIHCIWEYEDDESEYSEDGRSYDGSYRRYPTYNYDDGMSYARGRGRNAKRDAMGRYSRDYRGGSYERGYSRDGKEEYIENLRSIAEDAPDEATKQSIMRMIKQIEQH